MGSELNVSPDSKPQAVYSPVSIWWAVWAVVWTVVVLLGMAYLVVNRHAPALRIRGLYLSLAAMGFLHVYFISVQFGVMAGPLLPGDAEYWIMGLYLPIGVGLFHASNMRFLHVATLQKKYAHRDSRVIDDDAADDSKWNDNGWIARFRRLDYTTKTIIIVGTGILIQIFLTVLMWIISRKWHSSWGIPGTEVHGSPMQQKAEMGTGWEWWPTCVWQLAWSWIVAPITLWKARHIHDTQGWRVQTIGCAIANLPGTPLWLIGINVSGMAPVNAVWLPPQWVCLSIIFTEIFTIFLPCWEVKRQHSLRKETLDAISQWEKRVKGSGSEDKSSITASTMVDSMMTGFKSGNVSVNTTSSRESILTMGALEHVLQQNPAPLQDFSALHDFSGENIAFLTSVAEWKSSLPKSTFSDTLSPSDTSIKELTRERFNRALHIYAEFISINHAEFPVNISSQDLRKLDAIFGGPARARYGESRTVDPVTPFDKFSFSKEDLEPPATPISEQGSTTAIHMTPKGDRAQYWGEVPDEFNANVFDDAEKSIKYLVLTNTWPKFVKSHRISTDSTVAGTGEDAV